MGQKINPFGYRLGITENHRSKWFSDSNKVGERYRDSFSKMTSSARP